MLARKQIMRGVKRRVLVAFVGLHVEFSTYVSHLREVSDNG